MDRGYTGVAVDRDGVMKAPSSRDKVMTMVNPATMNALSRTLLLLRDHVGPSADDASLMRALTGVTIVVAGDRANLRVASAQHALVTAALLSARSGGQLFIDVPDVPLLGLQAPLTGDHLEAALLETLADVLPGGAAAGGHPKAPADLAIVLGESRWRGRARRVLRVNGDAWAGAITDGGTGSRWKEWSSPFGALAAAGLAAGEAFKSAVASLESYATEPRAFRELFAPSTGAEVRLAPAGAMDAVADLGRFDCVSGGAIIHGVMYALSRIRGVEGGARVIEPEATEATNLNRYALLRHSRLRRQKAEDLADLDLGGLCVTPVVARYDGALQAELGPPSNPVLVGVDDIPTRWTAQAAWPCWLGVGATTHYSAMASIHTPGLGCARCLHPTDDPGGGPIPTVAFVSHWAGLWLAAFFTRHRGGAIASPVRQSVFMTSLRAESPAALWWGPVPPRDDCPLSCRSVGEAATAQR